MFPRYTVDRDGETTLIEYEPTQKLRKNDYFHLARCAYERGDQVAFQSYTERRQK